MSTTDSTTTKLSRTSIKELCVEQRDNILILKINRPHKRNALNRKAIYELIAAIESATHNHLIKLVVLTGVGDYFTAGIDLKQIQEYEKPEYYYRSANYVLRALVKTIMACTKLLVCLVNGPCIGIGFTLAALCDAVYCTKNAYFHTPFSQLGLCPEACSSYTFPQQFGKSWATKLLIFGEILPALQAQQLGFVLEVFDTNPDDEVEQRFWLKMKAYGNLSAESLRVTKSLIKANSEPNLISALYAELHELEKLRSSPVYNQAINKFMQKSSNIKTSKL